VCEGEDGGDTDGDADGAARERARAGAWCWHGVGSAGRVHACS
jgi:hypothetical protein